MLSDEEREIFNNLKDYMQSNIDNGYHKFIYNDLGWDFKCIDCINAIDKVLKQSKEIEELKEDNKHQWEERCKLTFELENSTSNDKIKAKIEEIDNIFKNNRLIDKLKNYFEAQKEVLQSLLEKE